MHTRAQVLNRDIGVAWRTLEVSYEGRNEPVPACNCWILKVAQQLKALPGEAYSRKNGCTVGAVSMCTRPGNGGEFVRERDRQHIRRANANVLGRG
jgi:hypothetical protein